jgi:hypothetical protein
MEPATIKTVRTIGSFPERLAGLLMRGRAHGLRPERNVKPFTKYSRTYYAIRMMSLFLVRAISSVAACSGETDGNLLARGSALVRQLPPCPLPNETFMTSKPEDPDPVARCR